MDIDYASGKTPSEYVCKCGATGCKLWRPNYGMAPLLCGPCALAKAGESGAIDHRGRVESEYGLTDQIGSYLPAVPDEEGHGFWGYTSVPDEACAWWRALPSMPTGASPMADEPDPIVGAHGAT